MTNEELLSKTISYLRFPLTVGVVYIHFSLEEGLAINGKIYGLDNPDWYFFIVNLISQTFARVGVPLFFVISGFLFFYRIDFNSDVYKKKLRSRVTTLLIPYILWNIIAILWQLKCFIPGISSFIHPVEIRISLIRIINTFFCNTYHSGIILGPPYFSEAGLYPIDGPLWYVRDLLVMVTISPIIYWIIKKGGAGSVVIIGLIWLFSSIIFPEGSNYLFMFVTASFFFSCGAYYSIFNSNFVVSFRKLKYAPMAYIIIAILDALTKHQNCNVYLHKVGILFGVVSIVVIVSNLLMLEKVKVNNTLENSSFFIFALHFLFIGELGKVIFVLFRVDDSNPYTMLALYFIIPILTVLLCLGLYVLLKSYLPRICNLLTGGR